MGLFVCNLSGLPCYSPELRHGFGLYVTFLFYKFSLFHKMLASICLFICKMFFLDNLLDLCGHMTDNAVNWKKYGRLSYKTSTN